MNDMMQGQNGSHFEARPVPPPLPNKCDWEVDPSEIDFSNSTRIGKVVHLTPSPIFSLFQCHYLIIIQLCRIVPLPTDSKTCAVSFFFLCGQLCFCSS